MSDKIKELAEQAGMTDDKFGMFFAKNKHNEDGVDLEKFAELIIRECAKLLEEMPRYYKQESDRQIERDTIFDCIRTIKEHFGVEE